MRNAKSPAAHDDPAWRGAVARMLQVLDAMTHDERSSLHPSYVRLIEAAQILRGVRGEAALTIALRSTDQQKVNNWQRRGVSRDGALDAERYIGCPATWIIDGKLPPCEAWEKLNAPKAEQEPPPYERDDIRQLRELAEKMDAESVKALVLMLKKLNPKQK